VAFTYNFSTLFHVSSILIPKETNMIFSREVIILLLTAMYIRQPNAPPEMIADQTRPPIFSGGLPKIFPMITGNRKIKTIPTVGVITRY
jgi:hypothetical protein